MFRSSQICLQEAASERSSALLLGVSFYTWPWSETSWMERAALQLRLRDLCLGRDSGIGIDCRSMLLVGCQEKCYKADSFESETSEAQILIIFLAVRPWQFF